LLTSIFYAQLDVIIITLPCLNCNNLNRTLHRTLTMVTNKLKRRLLRARVVLNQAIRQILEINRLRKQLPFFQNREAKAKEIEQDLKLLNKIAQQQAVLIKKYEGELETVETEL